MIADKILTFDQARHEYVKNIKIDIENNDISSEEVLIL